jgi:putative DNA primase/helicase
MIDTLKSVCATIRRLPVDPDLWDLRRGLAARSSTLQATPKNLAHFRICRVMLLQWMRANDDNRPCVVMIPAHALGDQQMDRFARIADGTGLVADVWRSRDAKVPAGEDAMCMDIDAVRDANNALVSPQKAVCRKKLTDGTELKCEFFDTCRFQKQKRKTPDVWFVAHQLLMLEAPSEIGDPAFVAIDESFWKVAQFGLLPVKGAMFGENDKSTIGIDVFKTESTKMAEDDQFGLKSQELYAYRVSVHAWLGYEFKRLSNELEPLQHFPAVRACLANYGITTESARAAFALEWKRKTEPAIFPGMPAAQRKELVASVVHNKMVRKLAMFWKALEHLTQLPANQRSGYIELGMSKGRNEEKYHAVRIKGHRSVKDVWNLPTLLLDATMRVEPIREIYHDVRITADIKIQAPHQHIYQVLDKSFSKNQLSKEAGLRNVHAIICKIARQYYPKRVLVVCQLDVEEALKSIRPGKNGKEAPLYGNFPSNVETEHHNNVAGKDQYGPGPGREGVATEIVIGRTAASPEAVEVMAEAQTGLAVDRLPKGSEHWYPQRDAVREMADGTFIAAQTDFHPDPLCEAIRWEICEGQLIQIIGRGRGSRRTADNPVDVWLLTNAVLPIPIKEMISAASLEPSAHDLMMAAGGFAFTNAAHAQAAYPNVWDKSEAARQAFHRHPGKDPYGTEVTYQREGHQPCTGHFDPHMIPDVEAWLTDKLGTLTRCEVAGQAKPAAETQEADVWTKAMARMPGRVLPMTKAWLSANHRDLFGSERTAADRVRDYRVQKSTRSVTKSDIYSPIYDCHTPPPKVALFKLPGQKVASRAMVGHDAAEPKAALAELLGAEVVSFEWETPAVTASSEATPPPEPDIRNEVVQPFGMPITDDDGDDDEDTPESHVLAAMMKSPTPSPTPTGMP